MYTITQTPDSRFILIVVDKCYINSMNNKVHFKNNKKEKTNMKKSNNTKQEINDLYNQEQKRFLDYKRKDEPEREKKLLERFGKERLEYLRYSLDDIQNDIAYAIFSNNTPLIVTNEELIFLEEEDKLQKRFFVDFMLYEFNKDTKSFFPRWCRQPFQTNTQVKGTLKWIYKTNQKVEYLSIIDENDLDLDVNCPMKDGSYKHYPLRVVRFDERYSWKELSWKHKIHITHDVWIKVVTQKEVTSFMNRRKKYIKKMEENLLSIDKNISEIDF